MKATGACRIDIGTVGSQETHVVLFGIKAEPFTFRIILAKVETLIGVVKKVVVDKSAVVANSGLKTLIKRTIRSSGVTIAAFVRVKVAIGKEQTTVVSLKPSEIFTFGILLAFVSAVFKSRSECRINYMGFVTLSGIVARVGIGYYKLY